MHNTDCKNEMCYKCRIIFNAVLIHCGQNKFFVNSLLSTGKRLGRIKVFHSTSLSNFYSIVDWQNPLCAWSIALYLPYSKVNDFFERAVMLLPMENCDSSELQEMYLNFIQEFGTHYTTEVVMGAKAVQQLTFSKSDLSKLESEGISAKVGVRNKENEKEWKVTDSWPGARILVMTDRQTDRQTDREVTSKGFSENLAIYANILSIYNKLTHVSYVSRSTSFSLHRKCNG